MKFLKMKSSKVRKLALFCAVVMSMTVLMAMGVFASTEEFTAIADGALDPILEGAKQNIGVVMPVAIGLFAILLGVGFVPMLIKKFRH